MKDANTLLIIEDDLDTQEILTAFFRPKGFAVLTMDDASKALEQLQSGELVCDVILTDLKLPNISGMELTKRLREAGIDTPIVLMTAQRGVQVAIEAIETGAFDFVVKPLHFPQLQISIERALHFSRLKKENSVLKTAYRLKTGSMAEDIIGQSPGFLKALDLAKRVSSSTANVFILGESGTGKEVIARSVHNMGTRSKGPFIAVNCSAIPETLLESELFGHAKGAFTGAIDKKIGLFEEAEGGTLFLDEIGDLPLSLQAKLLRVLQEKKIKRIGENQVRKVDARIVTATHKDLRTEVAGGRFREDLFFRLNVIQIKIPPLRERKEDITPLAEFFLKKFAALNESRVKGFTKAAMIKLLDNPWRGNVRELENAVERAVVLSESDVIGAEDLPGESEAFVEHDEKPTGSTFDWITSEDILPMEEVEKRYILYALKKNEGAKEKTARDLKMDRKTLYRRLQSIGMDA